MKKYFTIAALAALLGAPALGQNTRSVEVDLPAALETQADYEAARAAILDAATELCEGVRYTGVSAFYKPGLDRECVADAYADALAQEPTGALMAWARSEADPYLILAEN